ncbi:transcriptional regulator [Peptococcaceae bacterium SCADC1_2_3]|nr:transcriptional regulator [Peptococcaceae bacterium SCADC1_2_3]KFI36309.1 transcriptional regulator [Peptococcaceae bacterium SCADC1_2_3]KFI37832.1 transcriptional regulator [Peptococcaceae bacterium SCADC1_2_3]
MSGHSKWSTIKRKKERVDAQRGKIFARLSREIIVAARMGGSDPEANFRLRLAISKAKEANIPLENIQRAIQKGSGEIAGKQYEEIIYEGYGPGGAAIMCEVMTDNRNRMAGEIRFLFSRHGGSLGETGCVSWLFDKKGLLVVPKDKVKEDELLLLAMEAGAEDVKVAEDSFEVISAPEDFEAVKNKLLAHNIPLIEADITMIPKSTVDLSEAEADRLIRLLDALEEHDEVQEVYVNVVVSG